MNLTQVQNSLKKLHAFIGEVKKTEGCFALGMDKMAKAQEAYGCVGDLANLASGNNAKRLVFEQYVLAELINSGDFERHINRVRRERRKKKEDKEEEEVGKVWSGGRKRRQPGLNSFY